MKILMNRFALLAAVAGILASTLVMGCGGDDTTTRDTSTGDTSTRLTSLDSQIDRTGDSQASQRPLPFTGLTSGSYPCWAC